VLAAGLHTVTGSILFRRLALDAFANMGVDAQFALCFFLFWLNDAARVPCQFMQDVFY
jgi:hypothetical protein